MNSHQLLELIEPTESMVHQILEWRNNPEIRRWMVNTDEISKDDHLKWWSNTKSILKNTYLSVRIVTRPKES